MLAGTSALGTQVQVRVGKTGLGLLGVPGEYTAQGWRPWSWAQAHQERTVGGGGEAEGRARCFPGAKCESVKVLVAQLCPALSSPMDCSSPGSSVHGILQL